MKNSIVIALLLLTACNEQDKSATENKGVIAGGFVAVVGNAQPTSQPTAAASSPQPKISYRDFEAMEDSKISWIGKYAVVYPDYSNDSHLDLSETMGGFFTTITFTLSNGCKGGVSGFSTWVSDNHMSFKSADGSCTMDLNRDDDGNVSIQELDGCQSQRNDQCNFDVGTFVKADRS
jgi:hypothetical protein